MKTRRREVLLGATATVATAGSLPAPAIAQGIKELKMVTSWPENLPGMQTSADRLARSITIMSDGRIKVTVYPAGSLVRAYEVFDAVGAGVADMYHTGEGVFEDKSPALNFAVLMDRVRWRAGVVGRGRRTVQYQAVDGRE